MYDLSLKVGKVVDIIDKDPELIKVEVTIDENVKFRAIGYLKLTGDMEVGDKVLLNTTAVDLGLGTGGYHFVCCNLSNPTEQDLEKRPGHIMKMRYTPFQVRTMSVEEKSGKYHERIKEFNNLDGQIVAILPLHSLLAPLVLTYKYFYPGHKIAYIMTEGAGLVLSFSNQVRELVKRGLLDTTITIGHAFGGDYEAVNIFTGLAAAREVAQADLIVTGMGPGIVGTATKLGFSGVENALINYAVRVIGGISIHIPRISFADKRERHFGLSHHSITLFKDLIDEAVNLAFPRNEYLIKQLEKTGIINKHYISFYSVQEVESILLNSKFPLRSMGRSFEDDPLFFISSGLAVYIIRKIVGE